MRWNRTKQCKGNKSDVRVECYLQPVVRGGKSKPGRGKSKWEGPEMGACLACLKFSKEVSIIWTEWASWSSS